MERFDKFDAVALPILQSNLDTDQIIPARFLRKPRTVGLGQFLFHDLRYDANGGEKEDFVLNAPPYREARIVVSKANFGCGSSRENAVWALADYGFRAAIAPSFGDIFANNCLQNGVLVIRLPNEIVNTTLNALINAPGTRIAIDLTTQTVTLPRSGPTHFDINPFDRYCLLNGVDELGYTLTHMPAINNFERRHTD